MTFFMIFILVIAAGFYITHRINKSHHKRWIKDTDGVFDFTHKGK